MWGSECVQRWGAGMLGHLPVWMEQQVQAWHGRGGEAGETGWGQIVGACEWGGGEGGIRTGTFPVGELLAASDFRGLSLLRYPCPVVFLRVWLDTNHCPLLQTRPLGPREGKLCLEAAQPGPRPRYSVLSWCSGYLQG